MKKVYLLSFLMCIITLGCGSPSSLSHLSGIEPTEEEYQAFLREIENLVTNHRDYAVEIVSFPLNSKESVSGETKKFFNEMQRLNSLDLMTKMPKYASAWPRMWKDKGIAFRDKYIAEQMQVQDFTPGKIITPLSFFLHPMTLPHYFFEQPEVEEAIVAIENYHKKAEWDGINENYVYKNFDDYLRVLKIASYIYSSHTRDEIKIFLKENPLLLEKIRTNKKTSDISTNYEPFDLIQTAIGNALFFNEAFSENYHPARLAFHKVAHRSLFHFLESRVEDDPIGAEIEDIMILRQLPEDEKFGIYCADGGSLNTLRTMENSTPYDIPGNFVKSEWNNFFDLLDKNDLTFSVQCRDTVYYLNVKEVQDESIPLPKTYNLNNYRGTDPLKIVISFALTQEMNKTARFLFHRYMNYYGFRHHGENHHIDTKKYFLRKSSMADVIVPISHNLDVNHFHIGTQHSVVSRYTKTFKRTDGKRVPVEIELFFPSLDSPPKSLINSTIQLTTDEIAHFLHSRRHVKDTPLVIFNSSCFSQNTLFTWMKAYRKSAQMSRDTGLIESFTELQDVPHIFGARNGFPTDNVADVFSNVSYPFHLIKFLALGKTPQEIQEIFEKGDEIRADLLISFFQKWIHKLKKGSERTETSFDPVYNANYPSLFSGSGFDIQITKGS